MHGRTKRETDDLGPAHLVFPGMQARLQSENGPLLHFEYCWSHFCMHFVPVHLELLQLTHFRSHMDARAEAGAVDHANRTIAQQAKAIRRLTWMVVVTNIILVSFC